MESLINDLNSKVELFKQYDETSQRYNDWQNKLSVPTTNFENLDECRNELLNRHLMWNSLKEWSDKTETWKSTLFSKIDAPNVASEAAKYAKICKRLEGAIDPNPIQQKLAFLVEQFEAAMPIVTALRNQDLQEMHWNDIRALIGQESFNVNEDGFTLQSLLDLNVVQYMDEIVAKSVEASG